ncbi:MAG: hypothetical protein KJO95_13125 [Gammaproteobacteria bacterium]|nr:hypothetical protein [Gammaproteobacteria bacterium]
MTTDRMTGAYAHQVALLVLALMVLQACGKSEVASKPAVEAASAAVTEAPAVAKAPELSIDADSFRCLTDMTAIRHFFVDNLLGDLDATIAVAESTDGGVYPPGSVVQLVPTEAMVKHPPGFNAATRDWEFFELDVSADGNSIRNRGFVDVVNRFGGNCFACHIKAEPKYDLICELEHGCDPIPITREMIAGIQAADPRCVE